MSAGAYGAPVTVRRIACLSAGLLAILLIAPAIANAVCNGMAATVGGATSGNDTLNGTSGNDVIEGLGGARQEEVQEEEALMRGCCASSNPFCD